MFNCAGYRFLCISMQMRATKMLDIALDEDRSQSGALISFKVPVRHLAYYNSSARFERRTGLVNIEGIQYQYVESRIFNDTLELHCVSNQTAAKWADGETHFFARVNGLGDPDQGKTRHITSGRVSADDYFSPVSDLFSPETTPAFLQHSRFYTAAIPKNSGASPDRPPQG